LTVTVLVWAPADEMDTVTSAANIPRVSKIGLPGLGAPSVIAFGSFCTAPSAVNTFGALSRSSV
jgi:hypothetical protein